MGELIILDDWKRDKALSDLDVLEEELRELIEYLGLEQEFFYFDDDGNPIRLIPTCTVAHANGSK